MPLHESASFYVLYPINTPFKDSSFWNCLFHVQKERTHAIMGTIMPLTGENYPGREGNKKQL